MKKVILIVVLIGLVIGCKRDPIPRDAIPRDQFVDILVDVHLAEALSMDRSRLKIDSIESSSMYLSVLEKHHVTEQEMLTTSLYYSRHQKEYKKIYTDVLDKISMMIEEENSPKDIKVNVDSLQNQKIKEVRSIESKGR